MCHALRFQGFQGIILAFPKGCVCSPGRRCDSEADKTRSSSCGPTRMVSRASAHQMSPGNVFIQTSRVLLVYSKFKCFI